MPIKSVKMKISKNKKLRFFLMSQGSFYPKIRFLGQKVCPVARSRTDGQTDRVTTVGTLSWFQDFFLQPIIKNRPNIHRAYTHTHIHNTAHDSIEASNLMLISNTAQLYLNVETYIHRSGKCAHCTRQNNT